MLRWMRKVSDGRTDAADKVSMFVERDAARGAGQAGKCCKIIRRDGGAICPAVAKRSGIIGMRVFEPINVRE